MKFVSYLTFDGRCREAFKFYAETLGGKIVAMISHGETPASEQVPADWHDKIINAHLVVGDQELMGCDAPPQFFNGHEGFSVSIQIDEEARPSESSQHLPRAARLPCRWRRPSGPSASACSGIASARRG